jgi:hypothetical protein
VITEMSSPGSDAPGAARAGVLRRALPWVWRWGISIASFVGGLLTLFVFRRGIEHIRWIIGYLLLLWLLFGVVTQVRGTLRASERRAHRLVVSAADYTIQSLYHGILLFLLPAYWASATLGSRNAVFLALLVALAAVATFDPWYRTLVQPRSWAGGVYLLVSSFGALALALPLIGVPPHVALLMSAWMAAVALTPAVVRALGWSWLETFGAMSLAGVVAATGVYAARAWIPPAPIFLARAALAWNVESVESLEPVTGAIHAGELHRRGLVAYTAIHAPAGLTQAVEHRWVHEGRLVNAVALSPVQGGRREGFRTWSRKLAWPANPAGRWSVDVVTSWGQLVGRLRFTVEP